MSQLSFQWLPAIIAGAAEGAITASSIRRRKQARSVACLLRAERRSITFRALVAEDDSTQEISPSLIRRSRIGAASSITAVGGKASCSIISLQMAAARLVEK